VVVAMMAVACTAAESDDADNESSAGTRSCDGEVDVPDPALAAALRMQLGVGDGAAIDGDALAELLHVDASSAGVTSLQGLECAHALQTITMYDNAITDVSPLAGLEHLAQVYMGENAITDVSPFAELPELSVLHLASNQIADVSALRGHARLHSLGLEGNAVTSTADIVDMPMLANLDLTDDPILVLEGLTGLSNLFSLRLGGTMISDLGALAAVPRVDNLHVERAALTSLDSLPAMPGLTWIDVSYNALTDVDVLGTPGFAALDQVTLDGNPLAGLESVAAIGVAHTISINDVGVADLSPLAVESSLARLSARGNGITDVGPVAWVRILELADNAIVDVGPLAGTSHGSVDLSDNAIVDASPLSDVEFESCATVSLVGNPLADADSVNDALCAAPVVVTDVCMPDACDPCGGAPDCG
jgi:internalin A